MNESSKKNCYFLNEQNLKIRFRWTENRLSLPSDEASPQELGLDKKQVEQLITSAEGNKALTDQSNNETIKLYVNHVDDLNYLLKTKEVKLVVDVIEDNSLRSQFKSGNVLQTTAKESPQFQPTLHRSNSLQASSNNILKDANANRESIQKSKAQCAADRDRLMSVDNHRPGEQNWREQYAVKNIDQQRSQPMDRRDCFSPNSLNRSMDINCFEDYRCQERPKKMCCNRCCETERCAPNKVCGAQTVNYCDCEGEDRIRSDCEVNRCFKQPCKNYCVSPTCQKQCQTQMRPETCSDIDLALPCRKQECCCEPERDLNLPCEQFESTLVIIKTEGVQRKLIGRIIKRFERKDLKITALKLTIPSKCILKKHFESLRQQQNCQQLIQGLCQEPLVAMVLCGNNAIKVATSLLGLANQGEVQAGTISGDFDGSIDANLCYCSCNGDAAKKDICLWFKPHELLNSKVNYDSFV